MLACSVFMTRPEFGATTSMAFMGSQIDEVVLANDNSAASAESIKAAIFLGGG